jgi:hypothetical protein
MGLSIRKLLNYRSEHQSSSSYSKNLSVTKRMTEVLRNLPKHKKYSSAYRRGDFFWGLGVEHETYIKTSQEKVFSSFSNAIDPERYSVSYYKSYKQEFLPRALDFIIEKANGKLKVPILMNSHSFTHTDKFNFHTTTFDKEPKPNPKADKLTFFEWICSQSSWFKSEYEKSFIWDGDSIEFMTQKFYKTSVKDVLDELHLAHDIFLSNLNSLPKQGLLIAYSPFTLAFPTNEPFACHLTNLKNISMFNNGTLHINFTLPTRLSFFKKQKASNWKKFVDDHKKFARLIQWIEPLWIACYGSADPLASTPHFSASKASQRLAVSRYIGLGTFDTNSMPRGKILQVPKSSLKIPWYDSFYKKTEYEPLKEIGLDINFNKHGAHGLELRFFDQMSYNSLEQILLQLVLLADVSLSYTSPIENPTESSLWQHSAEECLLHGKSWSVSSEYLILLASILKIKENPPEIPLSPSVALLWLFSHLPQNGFCWKRMVEAL